MKKQIKKTVKKVVKKVVKKTVKKAVKKTVKKDVKKVVKKKVNVKKEKPKMVITLTFENQNLDSAMVEVNTDNMSHYGAFKILNKLDCILEETKDNIIEKAVLHNLTKNPTKK